MASKRRYKFTEAEYSRGGKLSIIFAAASLLLLLTDVILSFAGGGQAGAYLGAVAAAAMLLAVYGFYVGMRSFREDCTSPVLSVIGSLLCGVSALLWLSLFLMGI